MNTTTGHSTEMHQFVRNVQDRAGLETYGESHQLSRAAMTVLGQSVSGGQAKKLAAWLPPELHAELAEEHGHATAFDKHAFLDKIAGFIPSVDLDEVEKQVSAVLRTLHGSAPEDELTDTIDQLPPELAALFR
ncbi:Uncharacterized conserved protein, DUF2267 family [Haloechinothrix alba]|uniref:Uncharacterized conserved protein, DUF2267 family n=1 Tax=Haloechinothrix alba TaxID=664784 RepID=A0A238VP58_9PSEU|nr:DUF2267 domain-containing protein [Haloechinothrix alba]SNR36016.1 Uncharacterized conserved protein, DUF2267 family [Haloechinothrix alba]